MQIDAKHITVECRNATQSHPQGSVEVKANRNEPVTKCTPDGQHQLHHRLIVIPAWTSLLKTKWLRCLADSGLLGVGDYGSEPGSLKVSLQLVSEVPKHCSDCRPKTFLRTGWWICITVVWRSGVADNVDIETGKPPYFRERGRPCLLCCTVGSIYGYKCLGSGKVLTLIK